MSLDSQRAAQAGAAPGLLTWLASTLAVAAFVALLWMWMAWRNAAPEPPPLHEPTFATPAAS